MKYTMNTATHAVELTIDEANPDDNSPMKINIGIGAGEPSGADDLIKSYKQIDAINAMTDSEQSTEILTAIAEFEANHSNGLKNIALIWDHDYPIMVQGDLEGYARWSLFMSLIHTLIYAYLGNTIPALPLTEKTRANLEHKAALLLNLSATHNLGDAMFHPATYAEVNEEKDRIAPYWNNEAC